ncbi:MAG: response regulator [Candidatus Zixiibacteriota bacterium]|nr:MAG: response regulator [candidate division Zixibacteria bacterium]
MSQFKLLLVDDSHNILKSLKRVFLSEGYDIHFADSAENALKVLNVEPIDLIITDENMPGTSGTDLLIRIKDLYPEIIRIMITGASDIEVAMKAINAGQIYRFFTKPWNDFDLLLAVRYALKEKALKIENKELKKVIKSQQCILEKLEDEHPGIGEIKVDEEGCIIIN